MDMEEKTCPYEYIVKCYNDDDAENTYKGVCFARNYTEAMSKIVDYYGNKYIEQATIVMNIDDPVYEFSEDSGILFNPKNIEMR